jgi:hypothetical protein
LTIAGAEPPARGDARDLLLVVAGALAALLIGYAAGSGTPAGLLAVAALGGIGLFVAAMTRPYVGYLGLILSTIMLIAFTLPSTKAVNLFDLLLWPVLASIAFGTGRSEARRRDAREIGPAHDAIRDAARRLARAVILFYALGVASIALMFVRVSPAAAIHSAGVLVRALQGVALFPVGMVLLSDGRRLAGARNALLAGGLLFTVINGLAIAVGHTARRSGVVWFANEPGWMIGSPNEAGTTIVLLWAVLVAWHTARPRWWKPVLLVGLLALLIATQSRSGLLAWVVFVVLTLRREHLRWVPLVVIGGLALLPLVPSAYWERMVRTASQERGSFELFSALMRVYSWQTSWLVFKANPLIGVGYLGFSAVSAGYNTLGAVLGQAESLYLETLSGLGLVGFAVLVFAIVRMYQLGRAVGRVAPPGSAAAAIARVHVSLLTALLVANITGDNLYGLIGVAQVAVWCAFVARTGHVSLAERRA